MTTASYEGDRARQWLAEVVQDYLGGGAVRAQGAYGLADAILAVPGVEVSMHGVLDANTMNLKGMRVTVSSPVLPIVEADAPWLFTPPEAGRD